LTKKPNLDLLSFVVPLQQNCKTFVTEKLKICEQSIEKSLAFCKSQCAKVVFPVKRVIKPFRALKYHLSHFAWRLRLWKAWTAVLTKYGMTLVKAKADELGTWLTMTGIGVV
jgi:hypothetical protein